MTTKSSPSELAEISNQSRVLNLALQGFDIPGIVKTTGLSEDTVRKHITTMRGDLTLRMQEAQEVWVAMQIARTEKIISKVMPIFDEVQQPAIKGTYQDGETSIQTYLSIIGDAAKIFTNMAKLQKDILQIKLDSAAGNAAKFVQNNTIIANGDFYQEALASMQKDMFGQSYEEMQEEAANIVNVLPAVQDDPRITHIEETLQKLLPSNAPDNDPD